MARWLRIGELAASCGVSIRTLHHYDELGLLRPEAQTEGGHRLYGEGSLLRLQQILTLRTLGLSLRAISELLDRPDFDLIASLRIQQEVLRQRQEELARAQQAIADLLQYRLETGHWDWQRVTRATTAVRQGEEGDVIMEKWYSPEQMERFAKVAETIPATEIEAIQNEWTMLLADVRANKHLDPRSSEAQALADRWQELTERTTRAYQSDPGLLQVIGEKYREGAFEGDLRMPQQDDFAFIQRVLDARQA